VTAIVFDMTSVSHFARAARLDALEAITSGGERLIPNEVATELHRGTTGYPAISEAFVLPWLTIVELDFPEVVHAAAFKSELGGGPMEHLGECAVLAWVKEHGGTGIVDDSAAVAMASYHRIPVRGTLSLIALGHKQGVLDRATAETLVDDLAATDMRLPVDGNSFFAWAYIKGLLP
jgi:predicted nucleic acid-binding protein